MKKLITAAALLIAAGCLAASAFAADADEPPPVTGPVTRSQTLLDGVAATPTTAPFRDGEKLVYNAYWNGISVGSAVMTVETEGTFEGRPAIHLKGTAKSSRGFSLVFSIQDAGESWVDPKGLHSLGFISDQAEGAVQDYQKWVMDYDRNQATRTRVRRKDGGELKKSYKSYPLSTTHVQDAFSMLYFYRAFPLKEGSKLESDVFVSKKVWKLIVEVTGREKVKVAAGSWDCLKVKPRVELNGEPQRKDSEMTIWVTDDERRMPVKIQSKVPLGKINAELASYTEGKQP